MHQGRETPRAWYLAPTPDAGMKWLVWFRRATAAIDASVVVTALVLPATTFPLRRLMPLIAAAALAHFELAREASLSDRTARWIRAASIGVEVALLTGLLELSGGPSSGFSVVSVVLVALAGATLGRVWAGIAGAWAAVCYGVLIIWHLEELVPAHHRLIDFPTHLFMMWLTIGALVQLAAHFVLEASTAVARREAQVEDMRRQAGRASGLPGIVASRAGVVHVLPSLIKNAFDATESTQPVAIDVTATTRSFRFAVEDQGPGMSPVVLRRAGDLSSRRRNQAGGSEAR